MNWWRRRRSWRKCPKDAEEEKISLGQDVYIFKIYIWCVNASWSIGLVVYDVRSFDVGRQHHPQDSAKKIISCSSRQLCPVQSSQYSSMMDNRLASVSVAGTSTCCCRLAKISWLSRCTKKNATTSLFFTMGWISSLQGESGVILRPRLPALAGSALLAALAVVFEQSARALCSRRSSSHTSSPKHSACTVSHGPVSPAAAAVTRCSRSQVAVPDLSDTRLFPSSVFPALAARFPSLHGERHWCPRRVLLGLHETSAGTRVDEATRAELVPDERALLGSHLRRLLDSTVLPIVHCTSIRGVLLQASWLHVPQHTASLGRGLRLFLTASTYPARPRHEGAGGSFGNGVGMRGCFV